MELEFTCEDGHTEVKLDRLCMICNGSGKNTDSSIIIPCSNCEGVGYIQTPAGEAIMRLMLRHQ